MAALRLLDAALAAQRPEWDNREIAKLLCLCREAFGWSQKKLFRVALTRCTDCVDAEFVVELQAHEVHLRAPRLIALVEATSRGFDALCEKIVMLVECGALHPHDAVCRETLAAVVDADDETGRRAQFAARLCECLSTKKMAGKLLNEFCAAGSTAAGNAEFVADVVTRDFFLDLEGAMKGFLKRFPRELRGLIREKMASFADDFANDSDEDAEGNLRGFIVDEVEMSGSDDAKADEDDKDEEEKPFHFGFTDSEKEGSSGADDHDDANDDSESDGDSDSDVQPLKRGSRRNGGRVESDSDSEPAGKSHLDLTAPTALDESDDDSDDSSEANAASMPPPPAGPAPRDARRLVGGSKYSLMAFVDDEAVGENGNGKRKRKKPVRKKRGVNDRVRAVREKEAGGNEGGVRSRKRIETANGDDADEESSSEEEDGLGEQVLGEAAPNKKPRKGRPSLRVDERGVSDDSSDDSSGGETSAVKVRKQAADGIEDVSAGVEEDGADSGATPTVVTEATEADDDATLPVYTYAKDDSDDGDGATIKRIHTPKRPRKEENTPTPEVASSTRKKRRRRSRKKQISN